MTRTGRNIRRSLTAAQRRAIDAMPFRGGVVTAGVATRRTMEALRDLGLVRFDGALYFLTSLGDYVQDAE